MTGRDVPLNRSRSLLGSERQSTSMSLPLAVHYKLGRLAELAAAANASRAEIVAMLIAEADLDPGSLARRVLAYRELTVGDVVAPLDPPVEESEGVVMLPVSRPGRPRRPRP
jgi:hypothetical protein